MNFRGISPTLNTPSATPPNSCPSSLKYIHSIPTFPKVLTQSSINFKSKISSVIVNFMYQLDGPLGAKIFGQTLLWICLWGYLWMRFTFESGNWVKQIALPDVSGSHPNSCKAWIEQKGWVKGTPPAWLTAFGLSQKHQPFLSLEPACLWTRTTPSALLGLQLADYGFWDLSASIISWANSL